MKSSTGKTSCIALAALAILIFGIPLAKGQGTPAEEFVQVQKVDLRGQRPQGAIVAAVSASRQDVVVVVVAGAGEALVEETEGNLKALIGNGFTRLGLILCDQLPDEVAPAVIVYSRGFTYAVIKGARPDYKTGVDLLKSVQGAYEEDILPKLKLEGDPQKRVSKS